MDGALNLTAQATVDQLVSEDATQATAILHYVQVLCNTLLTKCVCCIFNLFFFQEGESSLTRRLLMGPSEFLMDTDEPF